jgi:hypothetical protein
MRRNEPASLLGPSWKYFLRCERWHYKSGRSSRRLFSKTGAHWKIGRDPWLSRAQSQLFRLAVAESRGLERAIPANDPYETNFIDHGQRNIFRQSWQRRADISVSKTTQITERSSLRFTFDVFNLTNTASFDIPIDDITQNINFNGFPNVGQAGATTPCNQDFTALYVCPSQSGLGPANKTIGSPRQIQMSMRLIF